MYVCIYVYPIAITIRYDDTSIAVLIAHLQLLIAYCPLPIVRPFGFSLWYIL